MVEFNWKNFIDKKIVVNCDNEYEARDFLVEAYRQGIQWANGKDYQDSHYRFGYCYWIYGGDLAVCKVSEVWTSDIVNWKDYSQSFTERYGVDVQEFFNSGKIQAIRVKNQEEDFLLLAEFDRLGRRWCSQNSYLKVSKWGKYSDLCYNNHGEYCHQDWYIENGYEIINLTKIEEPKYKICFNLQQFRSQEFCVHCETEEEADKFCKTVRKLLDWQSEFGFTELGWNTYKSKVVYWGDGCFSSLGFALSNDKKVYKYKDLVFIAPDPVWDSATAPIPAPKVKDIVSSSTPVEKQLENSIYWSKFEKGKIAIKCLDQKEYDEFVIALEKLGYRWHYYGYSSLKTLTYDSDYACFCANNGRYLLGRAGQGYYEDMGIKVVTYKDFISNSNRKVFFKKQLKTGMVVVLRNGWEQMVWGSDLIDDHGDAVGQLKDYSRTLKHTSKSNYDIIAVYSRFSCFTPLEVGALGREQLWVRED